MERNDMVKDPAIIAAQFTADPVEAHFEEKTDGIAGLRTRLYGLCFGLLGLDAGGAPTAEPATPFGAGVAEAMAAAQALGAKRIRVVDARGQLERRLFFGIQRHPERYPLEYDLVDAKAAEPALESLVCELGNGAQLPEGVFGELAAPTVWERVERRLGWLAPGGRAAIFVPASALSAWSDADARAALVERGCIEAAVELDPDLSILLGEEPMALLIVRRPGGDGPRLADARGVALDDPGEAAAQIASLLDAAEALGSADAAERGAIIKPSMHAGGHPEGFIPLGELALKITRGTTLSASQIEECKEAGATAHPKDIAWYLSVGDLDESSLAGMGLSELLLGAEGIALAGLDGSQERYFVQGGDLIVNKMRPYRLALARVREGERVLPSGNLLIIRPDMGRLLPQYLLAYLRSEDGRRQLAACAGEGGSLSKKALEQLMVPVAPMAEQERIAGEYERMRLELAELERGCARLRAESARLVP